MPSNPTPRGLQFQGLKIAGSWKCNACCSHCSVTAGPRVRGKVDRGLALACIDDAAGLGLSFLEVTGGEAFLFYKDLLAFLQRASEYGMPSAVDTNAFWAKTVAIAIRRLERLKSLGLRRIVVSTDRWHQPFVPLERVAHAVEAADALGIEISVTVCALTGDPCLLETVSRLRGRGAAVQIQRVAPFGRAAGLPREDMLRCSFEAAGAPCQAIRTPTVGPDGRVTLCCAPPLRFPARIARLSPLVLGWAGRESLRNILLRAEQDPLLALLASGGAAKLIAHARGSDPGFYAPREEGYFGSCDLCTEILTSPARVAHLRQILAAGAEPHQGGLR